MTSEYTKGQEAMREACARECENRLERVMLDTGLVRVPGTLKSAIELRGAAAAIRAIDVSPLPKDESASR